jgi:hypothetical protein
LQRFDSNWRPYSHVVNKSFPKNPTIYYKSSWQYNKNHHPKGEGCGKGIDMLRICLSFSLNLSISPMEDVRSICAMSCLSIRKLIKIPLRRDIMSILSRFSVTAVSQIANLQNSTKRTIKIQ